jgi:PAS domain S-box-containing protein
VLRQVAGRYRELFDVSPHGIAYVDLDGHLIECNQAYLDMLGYASMIEVQRASVCCEMQHQLVQDTMLEQASAEGISAVQPRPAECCQKNGQPIRLLVQTWLSRNKKGDPIGMWISCHVREGEKA